MTTPPKKPHSDLARPNDLADDETPFREPTNEEWAELDAWGERNKDALAESIHRADEEFARGEFYTHEEVVAHLEADRRRRMSKS